MNSGKHFKHILIGLLIVGANVLIAQTSFNKVIGLDTNAEFGSIVVRTDTGFLVSYGDVDETLLTYCMGVLALDKKGNVLKKSRYCFGENKIVRYGRSLTLSNGNVAHYGTLQQYDTLKKDFTTWTALTMFTPLGDTLWTKQYLDSNKRVTACTLFEASDSVLYLISTEKIIQQNQNVLLTKVDKKGNEISSHRIFLSGNIAIFSMLKHLNGKYYIGGYNNKDPFVAELDSKLNVSWSKSYLSGNGSGALLVLLNDGNMAFGSDTLIRSQGVGFNWTKKQIFKIDTIGNVVWRKIHDEEGESNYYDKVLEEINGQLFIGGRRKPLDGIHYTLTKLTPEGDTIWMHRYTYENIEDNNYLWDMVATDDGGVLMVGDVTPNGSRYQDVWLVKVDSNGCINNDCEKTLVYDIRVSVKEEVKAENSIFIYPNPSSGFLKIEGLHPGAVYRYTVVNGIGQIKQQGVLSGGKLNVEQITSGIYSLILYTHSGTRVTQKLVIRE